jgi:hypothetical protein
MASIRINGVTIASGQNISIIGDQILVDGKGTMLEAKNIVIEIHGNVETLDVDICNRVRGNVTTTSGNVEVAEVFLVMSKRCLAT